MNLTTIRHYSFGRLLKDNENHLKVQMIYYYCCLLVFCMLFNLNKYLDFALTVSFVVLFSFNFQKKFFIYSYFAMIFFESKLAIPGFSISVMRLLSIFYFMRVCFKYKTYEINLKTLTPSIIFAVFYLLFRSKFNSFLSVISNLLVIFIVLNELNIGSNEEKNTNIKELLCVLSIFATFCGFYGFYNGIILNYDGFSRRCGTIDDPNYSALLYLLGLASLLGTANYFKKWQKTIIFISLILNILLTVSLTAFFILFIILFIYGFYIMPKKAIIVLVIMVILSLGFIYLPLPKDTFLYGIQKRIFDIIDLFFKGDFNSITSGRSKITSEYITYFKSLPIKNKLIGGNNTLSGSFRDEMISKIGNVSHNSYIDMLYAEGILGTIIITGFLLFSLVRNYINLRKTKQIYFLSFMLLIIILLLFSFSLSIYTYRYFTGFMFF